MKKIITVLGVLSIILALTFSLEMTTSATSSLQDSFTARYGSVLVNRYSCGLCHPNNVFTELNAYSQDLADAIAESGACLEFYPPNTHTITLGRCGYDHAPGLMTPYSSNCTRCHGVDLDGLIAPSCFLCHGKRWSEEANSEEQSRDISPADINDAFAAIEDVDSDGDGFSNIDEINADTHPGDATSFPGGVPEMTVTVKTTWDRDWYDSGRALKFTLKPEGATEIDMTKPIYLQSKEGKLYPTKFKKNGNNIIVSVPRALLYTLFKNFEVETATVTVKAMTAFDEELSVDLEITLSGDAPVPVKNVKLAFDPKVWNGTDDVTVTIKGDTGGVIDINKAITAFGPGGKAKLSNVAREGNNVVGTLAAKDALDIIGDGVENTAYTVSVVGSTAVVGTAATGESVLVAFNTASIEGGGGPECFEFDPPASHDIEKSAGGCTYLHAAGYDDPFNNNCGICHGSDLLGSAFAPSCELCHGDLWSTPRAPVTK